MRRKLLISPHNDDEVLFASFTLLDEHPEVVFVYDSYTQPSRGHQFATVENRRNESIKALLQLGIHRGVTFLGLRDDVVDEDQVEKALKNIRGPRIDDVWLPAPEKSGGNRHHDLVSKVGRLVFGKEQLAPAYLTYSSNGKSTDGEEVVPRDPRYVERKLLAMSCYYSQMLIPDTLPHFMRDLREYRERR